MLPRALCGLYGRKQHNTERSQLESCMHLHNFLCYYYRTIEVIVSIIILVIVFSIIHVAEDQNDEIHHVDSKIQDTL